MRHARHRCAPGVFALPLSQQVELVLGPGRRSAFSSDEERRFAWERHRQQLLALEPPGRLPWAYWRYEIGLRERPMAEPPAPPARRCPPG
jgi:hypothetical protein